MPNANEPNIPGGTDLLDRDPTIKNEEKTKKPSMYKVILHNDDYTPFELVVVILQEVFRQNQQQAIATMLAAHQGGACVCGVYSLDVAETKATEAETFAKAHDFALRFSVEKD